MELEKSRKPVGRFAVLNDRKPDTTVYEITGKDTSDAKTLPVTWYEAVTVDYPLVVSGWDLGSLPYYGYGLTREVAITDLLRTIRSVTVRPAQRLGIKNEM
jgi:hypothetical protein